MSRVDGPLTRTQLGALHGEFRRLGLGGDSGREERLRTCAVLLGGGEDIESLRDLTLGDANLLISMLGECGSDAELQVAVAVAAKVPRRPCRHEPITVPPSPAPAPSSR